MSQVSPLNHNSQQGALIPDALPHGVRGVQEYPFFDGPWLDFLSICLYVIVICLILLAILSFFRRKSKASIRRAHPLSVAKHYLDSIVVSEEFGRQEQKDFYYELSLGWRRFLDVKTGQNLSDSTLKEIRHKLQFCDDLPENMKQWSLDFFQFSDMVKFADEHSSVEEAKTYHNQVLSFIEQLMPSVEEIEAYEKGETIL